MLPIFTATLPYGEEQLPGGSQAVALLEGRNAQSPYSEVVRASFFCVCARIQPLDAHETNRPSENQDQKIMELGEAGVKQIAMLLFAPKGEDIGYVLKRISRQVIPQLG